MIKKSFDSLLTYSPMMIKGALQTLLDNKEGDFEITLPWDALTQTKFQRHRIALISFLSEKGFYLKAVSKIGKTGKYQGELLFVKGDKPSSIEFKYEGNPVEKLLPDQGMLGEIGVPSFQVYCRGRSSAGNSPVISFGEIANIKSGLTIVSGEKKPGAPVITAAYAAAHLIITASSVARASKIETAQDDLQDAFAFTSMGATKEEVAKPSIFAGFKKWEKALIANTVYIASIKQEYSDFKASLLKYFMSSKFREQLVLPEKRRVTLPIKGLRHVQIPKSVLKANHVLDNALTIAADSAMKHEAAEKVLLDALKSE